MRLPPLWVGADWSRPPPIHRPRGIAELFCSTTSSGPYPRCLRVRTGPYHKGECEKTQEEHLLPGRRCNRQRKPESGAMTRRTLHPNAAMLAFDQHFTKI